MCMSHVDFAYPLPCEICGEVEVSSGWKSFGYRALCTKCKKKETKKTKEQIADINDRKFTGKVINMFSKDKLVRHEESGLGQIQEYQSEKNEKGTLYVHFATHNLLVKESELTETNIKIDICYKYNGKTFFNLHDTGIYVDEKEFEKELRELFYHGCPSISCNDVVEFILEQPDKLRTILNKYKHL